ncbi:hypothetical protein ACIBIZ_14880 [Nonomuraea spiralis]|uniref:hypothetical protein n=1 Tax=Nonomuraea spiralis TaxID=46182 RepID=UPI0037971DDB
MSRRGMILGLGLALGAALVTPAPVAAAPPEGAYWHVREVMTTPQSGRFGTKANPYSLTQRTVMERWNAPDGRNWVGYRELATTPQTPADRKAWQRDGSPAKWDRSIDGKTVRLSTAPTKGHVSPGRNTGKFEVAQQYLTYDEVQRLPADPARLKDWLTRAARVGQIPDRALSGWITPELTRLMYDVPAPKEVREAAYRGLLTMPGVRADGQGKDELGRPGAAVVIQTLDGDGKAPEPFSERLIVDTARMVLLTHEQKANRDDKGLAGKTYVTTLAEVGWTDAQPVVPALS